MPTNNRKAFILALTATTLLTSGLARAASDSTPAQQAPTPQQTSASADFRKLSADGSNAFQDLTLTRLAIFDGRTDDAKKYIKQAETGFDKAKADKSVFTKAEADLRPPTAKTVSTGQTVGAAPSVNNSADSKSADQLKKPIAWLPVGGAMSINEDYTGSPAKTAAVAEANKHLKNGDRNEALTKLKLADVDIDIILAVVPLEQTIDDVHQAASLIDDGKYYEASQLLNKAQNGERFEVANATGTPPKK
jgi:hypothetical protein